MRPIRICVNKLKYNMKEIGFQDKNTKACFYFQTLYTSIKESFFMFYKNNTLKIKFRDRSDYSNGAESKPCTIYNLILLQNN